MPPKPKKEPGRPDTAPEARLSDALDRFLAKRSTLKGMLAKAKITIKDILPEVEGKMSRATAYRCEIVKQRLEEINGVKKPRKDIDAMGKTKNQEQERIRILANKVQLLALALEERDELLKSKDQYIAQLLAAMPGNVVPFKGHR